MIYCQIVRSTALEASVTITLHYFCDGSWWDVSADVSTCMHVLRWWWQSGVGFALIDVLVFQEGRDTTDILILYLIADDKPAACERVKHA